jgi:hypothetical protein
MEPFRECKKRKQECKFSGAHIHNVFPIEPFESHQTGKTPEGLSSDDTESVFIESPP